MSEKLKNIDPTVRAAVMPSSLNDDARTVDVVFATEAPVKRYSYTDGDVDEILEISSAAIRGKRLESGAPVLDSHSRWSTSSVVGKVERFWIEGKKAYATLRFSKREEVEGVWQDVRDAILTNVSVGYDVHKYEVTREDGKRPVYRAVDWEPMEVSVVPIPADADATVRAIDATAPQGAEIPYPPVDPDPLDEHTDEQTDDGQKTETRGIPPISITPKSTTMEPNEQGNQNPTPINEAQVREAAMKSERERVTSIRGIATKAGLPADVSNAMIERATEEGVSLEAFRAQVLDAVIQRQEIINNTRVTGMDETDNKRDAVQASLIIRAGSGVAGGVKLTDQERTLARQERGKTLLDLCKDSCVRAGISTTGLNTMEIVARAFTSSSSDFPVLLEGTARRILEANYEEAPFTWNQFCAIGTVSDFRDTTRLRMGTLENLTVVNENGEFQTKPISDADFEKVNVRTRGAIINVTRQMIINDDLSGFTRLASMLGQAAARTIEDLVYSTLLLNAGLGPNLQDGNPIFHARTGGNNIGSSTALTVGGLEADRVLMRSQKDKDGRAFLNIFPSILLVSLANEGTAKVLNNAQFDPDALNQINRPNIVNGMFQNIIASPRLTGNARYLFANPSQHPVLEVSFLQGEETPVMEQMPGFEVDGIKWKIRHDFGVNGVGFRGAVRNAGG